MTYITSLTSYFSWMFPSERLNSGLASYPDELLIEIFTKLYPKEIPPLMGTCKKFHRILSDPVFKMLIIRRLYPKFPKEFISFCPLISYREILSTEEKYELYELLESIDPINFQSIACKNKIKHTDCKLF